MIDTQSVEFQAWLLSSKESLFPGVLNFEIMTGGIKIFTEEHILLLSDPLQPPVIVEEIDPEQPSGL